MNIKKRWSKKDISNSKIKEVKYINKNNKRITLKKAGKDRDTIKSHGIDQTINIRINGLKMVNGMIRDSTIKTEMINKLMKQVGLFQFKLQKKPKSFIQVKILVKMDINKSKMTQWTCMHIVIIKTHNSSIQTNSTDSIINITIRIIIRITITRTNSNIIPTTMIRLFNKTNLKLSLMHNHLSQILMNLK